MRSGDPPGTGTPGDGGQSELVAATSSVRAVQASIGGLIGELEQLNRTVRRGKLLNRVVAALVAATVAGAGFTLYDLQQREHATCRHDNETRQIIRSVARDVGLATGEEGGEALIDAAGESAANEERISAYRENLERRLTARLEEITGRLEDRSC